MDDSEVTVADDAVTADTTPDPTPEDVPLVLPDLDALPAGQTVFSAGAEGNDVSYAAASGDDDAKVSARISPGVSAIISIDLGISVPSDKQVNFSLTDGANLDFRIKKTGDATAEIVVKDGVSLTSGQNNFQLVVNEFENAPANTEDVNIEVTVVIDNEPPEFTNAPASGTVAERAMDAAIATFSASDVNNQVLNYSIAAKDGDAGAASILPSLEIGMYSGALKTTEAAEVPVDQPDYIEDDAETTDVDESAGANEHVFVISVSDGTSSMTHEFTLTVTDVDDPAPGSNQKLTVMEDNAGGVDNSFGSGPALSGSGDFAIGQQIDNRGNITLDRDDILFDVDAASGAIYLKANKAGVIDFESGVTTYTLSILRGGLSGIVVISVSDVNEGTDLRRLGQGEGYADRSVRP